MLHTVARHCPYCGEPIELLVDASAAGQQYIEDCAVCCRPIEVRIGDTQDADGDAAPSVWLSGENDV